MRLQHIQAEALLKALDAPLFWSAVRAERWPSVRRRLEAHGVPYLAGPRGDAGFHVISTDAELATHTGHDAQEIPPEAATAILAFCDLQRTVICAEWATLIITVSAQDRPPLKIAEVG